MLNKYLAKLERKFGRFAIPNLMLYIVTGMGIFYVADMALSANPNNNVHLLEMISFNLAKIKSGEVWRVISFLLEPLPSSMPILVIFTLYFYWFMGSSMERLWGEFKFNVYYFTGVIFCIITGLLTGYATNTYLNLSLFLAFAILFPNEELYLFFFLPVKVKWLGLLDGFGLIYSFVTGDFYIRLYLILLLANLILFFGKDAVSMVYYSLRKLYNKYIKKL